MEHLPTSGGGQPSTKDELRAVTQDLVREIDAMRDDLLAEIRWSARHLTLSLATIMAVFNGIVFMALKLG
jgi:hypothetical protein